MCCYSVFFFKQKTAYVLRISDWSSDVCSSDLATLPGAVSGAAWLGVMVPQLPCELPQPAVLASSTRTLRPASSSAKTLASPITPPPTTSTPSRSPMSWPTQRRAGTHGARASDSRCPPPQYKQHITNNNH